jgi:hypothetical protein
MMHVVVSHANHVEQFLTATRVSSIGWMLIVDWVDRSTGAPAESPCRAQFPWPWAVTIDESWVV